MHHRPTNITSANLQKRVLQFSRLSFPAPAWLMIHDLSPEPTPSPIPPPPPPPPSYPNPPPHPYSPTAARGGFLKTAVARAPHDFLCVVFKAMRKELDPLSQSAMHGQAIKPTRYVGRQRLFSQTNLISPAGPEKINWDGGYLQKGRPNASGNTVSSWTGLEQVGFFFGFFCFAFFFPLPGFMFCHMRWIEGRIVFLKLTLTVVG